MGCAVQTNDEHTHYPEEDLGGGEIVEVRGKTLVRSSKLSQDPIVFCTEDAAVDASPAFLQVLINRKNHGRRKKETSVEMGFIDAAFFADGREMHDIIEEAKLVEPWMVAELIASHWHLSPPPLLTDLPNWFFFREGLVSVMYRERDKKWAIDIRPVGDALFLPGARVFVAF
jgi:hypothetical protein